MNYFLSVSLLSVERVLRFFVERERDEIRRVARISRIFSIDVFYS